MCAPDKLSPDFVADPYGSLTLIHVPVKLTQGTYSLVDKMMREEGAGLEAILTSCIRERYFRLNPCH